jgi:DNA repair protein RadC
VFREWFGAQDREHFGALLLDGRHCIIGATMISRGTANTTLVHPREVFRTAFLANSSALIVGHNHPSGQVSASQEDLAVFERLKKVGDLLGIPVIDSIVVGPCDEFHSTSMGGIGHIPWEPLKARAAPSAGPPWESLCHELLRDFCAAVDRDGKHWGDPTVVEAIPSVVRARRLLGLSPYRQDPPPSSDPWALEPL